MGYFLQPTTAPARQSRPTPVDNSGETAKNEVPQFFTVNSGRRFYSPELGRWLSRDPMGENAGPQRYTFVSNRPWDVIDMLGLYGKYSAVLMDWVETGFVLSPISLKDEVFAGLRPISSVDKDNCPQCRWCALYQRTTATFTPVQKMYLKVTVEYDNTQLSESDIAAMTAEMLGSIGRNTAAYVAGKVNEAMRDDAALLRHQGDLQLAAAYSGSHELEFLDFRVDEGSCVIMKGECSSTKDVLEAGYALQAVKKWKEFFSRLEPTGVFMGYGAPDPFVFEWDMSR